MRQAVLRDIVPILGSPFSLWVALPALLRGHDPLRQLAEADGGILGWLGFLWLTAELVTMLTNPMRRSVHDFIAGSVVLRVKSSRSMWLRYRGRATPGSTSLDVVS
jgi:uncharacterized RDD family membrane protein YckC